LPLPLRWPQNSAGEQDQDQVQMKMARFAAAALLAVVIAVTTFAQAYAAVPEYSVVIVRTYPHDPQAFTEGLIYKDGFLYESTGRNGQSSIRKVMLNTGKVVQHHDLDRQYFGEGIVDWNDRLIGLTWKSETGFVFDLGTLNQLSDFHYPGEGWALTQDGSRLIMSDGTSDVRFLDPDSLSETGRIHVTCDGQAIRNVNELEWVKGEIYANVWLTNLIIRINPQTGKVVGIVDVTDLAKRSGGDKSEKVPNGIAYDKAADRLFMTGKLWPALYQVRLTPRPGNHNLCRSLPQ
jgi:glutamine cyclotransferase